MTAERALTYEELESELDRVALELLGVMNQVQDLKVEIGAAGLAALFAGKSTDDSTDLLLRIYSKVRRILGEEE